VRTDIAGEEIKAYKFRSMVLGAESRKKELEYLNDRKTDRFFKIKNDPRVTKVGRLLRASRVDEVPQVINVLKGEKAIVGPRPHNRKRLRNIRKNTNICLISGQE
jgi:undecaprenyl-phosphate galactose phosphotransferase